MRASRRSVVAVLIAAGMLVVPLTASAGRDNRSRDGDRTSSKVARATATFDYTRNLRPIGFSAREVPLDNFRPRASVYNSDLAFWGETAVQGTYAGFRLIDVDDPDDPEEIIDWEDCASPTNTVGNQGDVIAWGPRGSRRPELIIRSWNSPTPAPRENFNSPTGAEIPVTDARRFTQPGAFCGDWPMFRVPGTPSHPVNPPALDRGQEGVHIIDVSDPEEPEVVAFVDLPCGSHTETLVPDLRNDRLLVYSNPSSGTVFGQPGAGEEPVHCNGFDIVEVPLDAPEDASYLHFESTGHPEDDPDDLHPCHDTGVILGDVNRVACAGGSGPTVWSIDRADGGSKEDPELLFHRDLGTQIGHSASFSWDGEVLIFGHEPGGGTQARCQASSSVARPHAVLPRRRDRRDARRVPPSATADRARELHVAQLQRRAHEQDEGAGLGQLPVGHLGRRLHRSRGPRGDRICRPGPAGRPESAGRHRERRRLVVVLV